MGMGFDCTRLPPHRSSLNGLEHCPFKSGDAGSSPVCGTISQERRLILKQEITNVNRGGVGFFGLLTIALIVLKLTGIVEMSWWLAFSPLMVLAGLWILLIGLAIAFALVFNKY